MSAKKVLIVDDEPNVVTYLETLLQDEGFETLTAQDGAEGMDVVRNERPDVVSLDINMPKVSGLKMFRELREDPELAPTKVIVVTAVTGYGDDPEEFRKFLASRPHLREPEGFIAKPIQPESFLQLVRDVTG